MNTAYVRKIFYHENEISEAMDSQGIGIWGINNNNKNHTSKFFNKKKEKYSL